MKYKDGMNLLSQLGLGAILISEDYYIIDVNEAGDRLLHGNGSLIDKSIKSISPMLCETENVPEFININFGEYLSICPVPEMEDLPPSTQLIIFRDSTNDAYLHMLNNVINNVSESIILCDENGQILIFNDAAVKMDALILQDIAGKPIENVYTMIDGENLAIPKIIKDKQPRLDVRQQYTTLYGRTVDIMANNYPIIKDNMLLGAYAVMKDWSQIDKLTKQVIELQSKLITPAISSKADRKSKLTAKYHFDDIVYKSTVMDNIINRCKRVAKTDSSVMIYGETGTGKELFAQSIHNASRRANRPFLAINCAAIPENLLESLLFGSEKGAYTGAEQREGLFEQANGGTLLLDEINSMHMSLQSKLLRVLQEGTVLRVGGTSEIKVDVRVLSNTNISPYEAIAENKLRQDLFYRLGVVNINIPPLRNRKEDIPLFIKFFMLNFNRKLLRNVHDIDEKVLDIFNKYDWPGNVRELQHAMEHAMNIMPDNVSIITMDYIPEHIINNQKQEVFAPLTEKEGAQLKDIIDNMECRVLCEKLRENYGNVSKTARDLGMSRQNVQYRIKKYNIDVKSLLR